MQGEFHKNGQRSLKRFTIKMCDCTKSLTTISLRCSASNRTMSGEDSRRLPFRILINDSSELVAAVIFPLLFQNRFKMCISNVTQLKTTQFNQNQTKQCALEVFGPHKHLLVFDIETPILRLFSTKSAHELMPDPLSAAKSMYSMPMLALSKSN